MSCNKDQRVVNKFTGLWELTRYESSNVDFGTKSDYLADPKNEITYEFSDCKLKDNDYCEVEIVNTDYDGYNTNVYTNTVEYHITEDWFSLEYWDPSISGLPDLPPTYLPYRILELNDTEFLIEARWENKVRTIAGVRV